MTQPRTALRRVAAYFGDGPLVVEDGIITRPEAEAAAPLRATIEDWLDEERLRGVNKNPPWNARQQTLIDVLALIDAAIAAPVPPERECHPPTTHRYEYDGTIRVCKRCGKVFDADAARMPEREAE